MKSKSEILDKIEELEEHYDDFPTMNAADAWQEALEWVLRS